ncbi:MAG: anaerobic carbon-monoxide dehydrogenase catalytic subunit [Armatimonadetes bacterium]|nr:anaerobic carbon-monoxide dehydrogenase catalytic subunit [Armatimonadota bacterium]
MRPIEERSIDDAARRLLQKAAQEQQQLSWDRWEKQQPQCGFGQLGLCCRLCNMGPCRIVPFGDGPREGVCGANADVITARNLLRMIAAGAAAHSDHGRDVAYALIEAARHPESGYRISDPQKLMRLAEEFEISTQGRAVEDVAEELGRKMLEEFGKAEGEVRMALRAPKPRVERWRQLGVMPRAIDREIVQIMHQTHMGVDADYRNLIMQGARASLADGWGGSMIATDLHDVLFRTPAALRAETNLGVLDPEYVNVVVHGHEPVLSEMMVVAAEDPELVQRAQQLGAKGIKLAGICCTANEILMRHGIPPAGSFLHQELAMMTGVVDAMVVDVQCIMPGLADVQGKYHTRLLTTSYKAKMPGITHVQFEEDRALDVAKEIVSIAVENFANRDPSSAVPVSDHVAPLVAGFSTEYVYTLLGGRFRPSYRPLNNAIIEGRIRGVAGVVGCENPRFTQGLYHNTLVKELLRHDVLVIATGCSALACAREGLLRPEAAYQYAGEGLREVCEAVGMPPVLHFGSCVDNSRILTACVEVLKEGGLGEDISDLPVAGAAPEWMSEKAIAIGMYVVSSGIFTVFSNPLPVMGSPAVNDLLTKEFESIFGATWAWCEDPVEAAHIMIERMNQKRKELKLREMMYKPVELEAVAAK